MAETPESLELARRMAELNALYQAIGTTEDAVMFEWMVHQLDHFLSGTEPCPVIHFEGCQCACRCLKKQVDRLQAENDRLRGACVPTERETEELRVVGAPWNLTVVVNGTPTDEDIEKTNAAIAEMLARWR